MLIFFKETEPDENMTASSSENLNDNEGRKSCVISPVSTKQHDGKQNQLWLNVPEIHCLRKSTPKLVKHKMFGCVIFM